MNTHEAITDIACCRSTGLNTVAGRTGHVPLEGQILVFKDRFPKGHQTRIANKLFEIGIAWNWMIYRCTNIGLMGKNKPTASGKGHHQGRESTEGGDTLPVRSHG